MGTRKKIGLVGAGQIGGTMAHLITLKGLANVALVDVAKGTAAGKALDIMQSRPLTGSDVTVSGGDDYAALEGASVVIVTAGLPRKPGMSRDDLLDKNVAIVKQVAENVKKHAPDAFIIVVTNPLDAMVYTMWKVAGFPTHKVVGMAGVLDSTRFRCFLAMETGYSVKDIQALVLGGHGDDMVPIIDCALIQGIPVRSFISEERIAAIVKRTREGGGEIVNLLGNGSAYYSPAQSAIDMAQAYINDEKRILPCAAYLKGEYGEKDVFAGVPAVIGAGGIEKVIELKLSDADKKAFATSISHVRGLVDEAKKRL